ncbi:LysR family transcriptional regulator [Shewanella surugensis]|uniref:LysR family transcriptional regulator n=1 Tax=Shewanella surugensis TaxID=212020 RepID=A0ABT0LKQ1_9GAMM|nr:LysR family transcriptional regulator [Shewanella surugensis]MCL1127887.1 LysR family transcriptional regulator [Shewanella surugensis]
MRHLKAFHVFQVAATAKSYSAAAKTLHITHGAVSKQIKLLEEYLGQVLFYRQGHRMKLTPKGYSLYAYTEQAFSALNKGIEVLSMQTQCIDVSCEPTLTMRWLMPRLVDFNDKHPTGNVRLSTAGGPIFLGKNGQSLAIRRNDFIIPSEYIQTPLVTEWVGPICSGDYWNKMESNVDNIILLHSETRLDAWPQWFKSNEPTMLENSQQTFAHFYFCIQAAQDGLGMAMGSYPLVVDELKRGNLVAPFGFTLSGHDYILLSLKEDVTQKGEIDFIDWLIYNIKNCVPSGVEIRCKGNI